jgi:hypothetical protein
LAHFFDPEDEGDMFLRNPDLSRKLSEGFSSSRPSTDFIHFIFSEHPQF